MGNSAFRLKIVYVDTDEIKVVKRPDDIDAGRSFIIVQTQCPTIWSHLFVVVGLITVIILVANLYRG